MCTTSFSSPGFLTLLRYHQILCKQCAMPLACFASNWQCAEVIIPCWLLNNGIFFIRNFLRIFSALGNDTVSRTRASKPFGRSSEIGECKFKPSKKVQRVGKCKSIDTKSEAKTIIFAWNERSTGNLFTLPFL